MEDAEHKETGKTLKKKKKKNHESYLSMRLLRVPVESRYIVGKVKLFMYLFF